VLAALGQSFFSLSLGMGAMITYGSYLPRTADLQLSGASVALFDTLVALLAGFMIFPAVFAMGKDPASGPTLIFEVLPDIFDRMPLGGPASFLFFVLLSIAALTSTVSLLEVVVSYFVDERRWSRTRSVALVGVSTFLIGLPSALSQGAVPGLSSWTVLGNPSFLYVMDFFWGNVSLAVGACLLSIFVGWVWGAVPAAVELGEASSAPASLLLPWRFFIRWICPVVILLVLFNLFGVV
jgi:NSS family neurotransmitter:Na+ symporter